MVAHRRVAPWAQPVEASTPPRAAPYDSVPFPPTLAASSLLRHFNAVDCMAALVGLLCHEQSHPMLSGRLIRLEIPLAGELPLVFALQLLP